MSLPIFVAVIVALTVVLGAGTAFGVKAWHHPLGKILAVACGMLLLAVLAGASFIMFLDWSIKQGAPY